MGVLIGVFRNVIFFFFFFNEFFFVLSSIWNAVMFPRAAVKCTSLLFFQLFTQLVTEAPDKGYYLEGWSWGSFIPAVLLLFCDVRTRKRLSL